MGKYVIQTMCRENYAAHNGFTGEFAWKNKPGSTYIVDASTSEEVDEVVNLIEDAPNDTMYEYVTDRFTAEDDYKSDFYKSQLEYEGQPGEAWMTIYTDNLIRKGKNGDWYMKRGYYAGMFNETREEFKHLAGKFIGWVDNLTTGETVCQIVDDKKVPLGTVAG